MNTRIALPALALVAAFAGSALAETPTIDNTPFHAARSRVEVQAELATFQQSGINPWLLSYQPLRSFESTQTRADVTAAYLASRNEVNALTGEDSGSAYLAQARATSVAPSTLAGQPANGL